MIDIGEMDRLKLTPNAYVLLYCLVSGERFPKYLVDAHYDRAIAELAMLNYVGFNDENPVVLKNPFPYLVINEMFNKLVALYPKHSENDLVNRKYTTSAWRARPKVFKLLKDDPTMFSKLEKAITNYLTEQINIKHNWLYLKEFYTFFRDDVYKDYIFEDRDDSFLGGTETLL